MALGHSFCWLNVLGGLVSPRGWYLDVWLVENLGREGSCILMLEFSWDDDVAVVASPLRGVVAALDEEPA